MMHSFKYILTILFAWVMSCFCVLAVAPIPGLGLVEPQRPRILFETKVVDANLRSEVALLHAPKIRLRMAKNIPIMVLRVRANNISPTNLTANIAPNLMWWGPWYCHSRWRIMVRIIPMVMISTW